MRTVLPESDVPLRFGETVHVRPVRRDDEQTLLVFYSGLSDAARYWRFFTGAANLETAVRRFARSPEERGLVAVAGGRIVAHAEYVPDGAGRAEIAFAVDDAWCGHGIATVLLDELAQAAAAEGVESFTAVVLPGNRRMLDVFRGCGRPVEMHARQGEIAVVLPL